MRALRLVGPDETAELRPEVVRARPRIVLSPPKTPMLDALLAAEQAAVKPRVEHRWHTERVLNTGTLRTERRTWCLRCDVRKDAIGEETSGECQGVEDARVMAPYLRTSSLPSSVDAADSSTGSGTSGTRQEEH